MINFGQLSPFDLIDYEDLITNIVNAHSAVKGTDLVLAIMANTNVSKFDNNLYVAALQNLCDSKAIVSMIYHPPNNFTGVMYFRGGTKFEL